MCMKRKKKQTEHPIQITNISQISDTYEFTPSIWERYSSSVEQLERKILRICQLEERNFFGKKE